LIEQADDVHITGSDRAFDAIVWGSRNKKDPTVKPVLQKPITSELGCVTPNIIVPGPYTTDDMRAMACTIIGAQSDNCGFNCNSPKLLVTCKRWPQREEFLKLCREAYGGLPVRFAYYPGATDRWNKFKTTYGAQAEIFGGEQQKEKRLPWLFIPGVAPKKGELALEMEPWAPILSESPLDCDPQEFLAKATTFCNDDVWGNLSASIYIHTETEAAQKDAFEKAIVDLKYGGVAINQWTALNYVYALPWGAYPGNDFRNIISGNGFVNNSFMIDDVSKGVVRFPLRLPLGFRPNFAVGSKNSEGVSDAAGDLALQPGLYNLGRYIWNMSWN